MSFFMDSDGNYSYGRLASYTCIFAAGIVAVLGRPPYEFLAAAVSFYLISKGQQVACNIWGGKNGQ